MKRQTKKAKTDGNNVQSSDDVVFEENSTGNVVQASDMVTFVRSTGNVVQSSDGLELVDSTSCVIQASDKIRLFNCDNVKVQGCDDMELKNVKDRKFKNMKGLHYDEQKDGKEKLEQKNDEYVPYTNCNMTVTGSKVVYMFPGFTIDCKTRVDLSTSSQITFSNGMRITIEKKAE